MADQCIICLEDLDVLPLPDSLVDDLPDACEVAAPSAELPPTHPGEPVNQQLIAAIKPCNHVLHDDCLKMWSQKANSCPICRQNFNVVQVLDKVAGTVLNEYEVADRKQIASTDFDPGWIEENIEDDEEENSTACPICDRADQEEILLLCDGCDAPYHTHCIGLDGVPRGRWFCMECEHGGLEARAAELGEAEPQRDPTLGRFHSRTQASVRRTRQQVRSDHWYGAWSTFSNRVHDVVGLDLDFSDDDQVLGSYRQIQRRTQNERREFQQWQQRLQIAGRQGARNVFRAAAPPRLQARRPETPATPVENVEETRAWGAFERAQQIDNTSPRSRKRKSTASPTHDSPVAPTEAERKLKRPRTRPVQPESSSAASSLMSRPRQQPSSSSSSSILPISPPARAVVNPNPEPSFLSSLLKEVEMGAASDEDSRSRSAFSTTTSSDRNHVISPSLEYSSPATSPSPSTSHTPRGLSITPPPHISHRHKSPVPLTSRIHPTFSPTNYSPNSSPREDSKKPDRDQSGQTTELRQPRPRRQAPRPLALSRSPDVSPVRANMSIETKEGINKIVKSVLAPHWKSAKISKEQYADINRTVSRKMYEMYEIDSDHDVSEEKHKWEKIATTEVATAVEALTA